MVHHSNAPVSVDVDTAGQREEHGVPMPQYFNSLPKMPVAWGEHVNVTMCLGEGGEEGVVVLSNMLFEQITHRSNAARNLSFPRTHHCWPTCHHRKSSGSSLLVLGSCLGQPPKGPCDCVVCLHRWHFGVGGQYPSPSHWAIAWLHLTASFAHLTALLYDCLFAEVWALEEAVPPGMVEPSASRPRLASWVGLSFLCDTDVPWLFFSYPPPKTSTPDILGGRIQDS